MGEGFASGDVRYSLGPLAISRNCNEPVIQIYGLRGTRGVSCEDRKLVAEFLSILIEFPFIQLCGNQYFDISTPCCTHAVPMFSTALHCHASTATFVRLAVLDLAVDKTNNTLYPFRHISTGVFAGRSAHPCYRQQGKLVSTFSNKHSAF